MKTHHDMKTDWTILRHIAVKKMNKWWKETERLGIEFNIHHMTNPANTKHSMELHSNEHKLLLSSADCRVNVNVCQCKRLFWSGFGCIGEWALLLPWFEHVYCVLIGVAKDGSNWVTILRHDKVASILDSPSGILASRYFPVRILKILNGPWNTAVNFKRRPGPLGPFEMT